MLVFIACFFSLLLLTCIGCSNHHTLLALERVRALVFRGVDNSALENFLFNVARSATRPNG